MKLTKYEQETLIGYNQEEKTASVYTYHPALIKKLDKACELYPDTFIFEQEQAGGRTYTIPKKYVSVRIPPLRTPEQRQAAADRMANVQNKRKIAVN